MTEYEEAVKLANRVLERVNADPNDDLAMLARQFLRSVEREELYRRALLPFAAAAGRPGRLLNGMNDEPLPADAVLGLGVKVSAWKRANELTGA